MNTLALGQGSFDLSRIGRRSRWWRWWWWWRRGSKTAPLHPEYFHRVGTRLPRGSIKTKGRKRERDDEESYVSSPYVIVRKRGMKNRVRQFRTMGTGRVEDTRRDITVGEKLVSSDRKRAIKTIVAVLIRAWFP